MKSLMTIIAVSEPKTDKNGKEYKQVTLQNPATRVEIDETTGEVMIIRTNSARATKTAYKESYLDGTPEWLYAAKAGELVEGSVESKACEPYEFTGRDGQPRIANSYKCAVFGDTTQANWEDLVKAAFRRNGHPLEGDIDLTVKKEEARVDITAGAGKKKAVVEEF